MSSGAEDVEEERVAEVEGPCQKSQPSTGSAKSSWNARIPVPTKSTTKP